MTLDDSRRAFINNLKAVSGASLALAALSPAQAAKAKKVASGSAGDPGLGIFNVRQYGAKGDGKTLDSAAIQSAIDACTSAGGGIVVFPNGTYLSGTIELKDYVTLHLAPQAVLFGSPNISDYPFKDAGLRDFAYSPTLVPTCALVYAYRAKGIAIESG
jgi:polygalacturonase